MLYFHVFVCAYACVKKGKWKSKADIQCFFILLLSTFIWDKVSKKVRLTNQWFPMNIISPSPVLRLQMSSVFFYIFVTLILLTKSRFFLSRKHFTSTFISQSPNQKLLETQNSYYLNLVSLRTQWTLELCVLSKASKTSNSVFPYHNFSCWVVHSRKTHILKVL